MEPLNEPLLTREMALMTQSLWNVFSSDYVTNCRKWTHFTGNPILPPSGSGWKRRWTANPDILAYHGRTLLYYRGNGALTDDIGELDRDRIGVALIEKIDPGILRLQDVTDGRPVIDVGPAGSFDSVNVLDPAAVIFQDKIWLYYSAYDAEGTQRIGLATSGDGIHFDKVGPVIAGVAPEVVLKEDVLYLYYQTFTEAKESLLHLATSTDGLHFSPVEVDPIFPRLSGQWDSLSIVTARIHGTGDGGYEMLYGGSTYLADEPDYFGLARSTDLIHWEAHPGNPIFGCGAKGEPDGGAMWFPAIVESEDHFVMLYEGSRGKYSWDLSSAICMAWIGVPLPASPPLVPR